MIGNTDELACRFGVIWLVLWMAFSIAIFGSGIDNDARTNGCENSEYPSGCSSGWWVSRNGSPQ